MTTLDDKLTEIESTLEFCEEVLLRNNLPEIINVKATIEQRLQELSVPPEFNTRLDYAGVKYVPNDLSFVPGKLVTTNTEPSLSVAEGKSLTEGLVSEDCTFTVITKDSVGHKTYSEIDEINVSISSPSKKQHIKTSVTNLKDGRYSVSYRPTTPGEFTVAVKTAGTSIMGSPFTLTVQKKPVNWKRSKSRKGITVDSTSAPRMEDAFTPVEYSHCNLGGACPHVFLVEELEDENSGDFEVNEDELEDGITIIVSGISPSITEDQMYNYFENARRSGGGEVSNIKYNDGGDAVIKFLEVKDLQRLLEGNHSINRKALTVTLQPPKKIIPPDPFRVHVQGLSEKTNGDCLSFYLEKFSGDVEVEEVHFGSNNNALVVFKTEPDFQLLFNKVHKDTKGQSALAFW